MKGMDRARFYKMWKRVVLFLTIGSFVVQSASINPKKIPTERKPSKESESTSYEEVEFDGEWECGGEDFTKLISYQMIAKDCPKLLHPVNNCCLGHDKCYEDQLGQVHCDKIFCSCLDKATYPAKHENRICHDEHAAYFCNMVQEFGKSFYEASANTTNTVGSGQEPREVHLIKVSLNETETIATHPRIYESRTHKSARAVKNLPDFEDFN